MHMLLLLIGVVTLGVVIAILMKVKKDENSKEKWGFGPISLPSPPAINNPTFAMPFAF